MTSWSWIALPLTWKGWYDIAPDNIPTITQCIIKLSLLDVTAAPEAETSEAAFHTWLQELSNLAQVQYLYCSPLYSAFLKRRFAQKTQLAKQSVGNRVETVRALSRRQIAPLNTWLSSWYRHWKIIQNRSSRSCACCGAPQALMTCWFSGSCAIGWCTSYYWTSLAGMTGRVSTQTHRKLSSPEFARGM